MFDPKSFLDFAHALLKDGSYDEETRFRTCVSRAYYGVFLKAWEIIPEQMKSQIIGRRSKHRWLIDKLQGSPNDENRQFGDSLDNLRKDRNKADYELTPFYGSKNTALSLARAIILWQNIPNLRF